MVVFSNCKINIGLRILAKRADGFHNLETVFAPVPLYDVLEVISSDIKEPTVNFSVSGASIDGDSTDNLCVKAYHLLQKDFPKIPAIKMHLHKAIPMGAGLGGGSADAAFTLKLLNEKYHLDLPEEKLINYALHLGSDCPFFIVNKPCYATGRGEILTSIDLNLSGYQLVLVKPGVHVNTRWAFSQLNKQPAANEQNLNEKSLAEIISQPVNSWKDEIINDFEEPVFTMYPQLKNIKDVLYNKGALYAAMSGSGSTVYGIFGKTDKPAFNFHGNYFFKSLVFK